MKQKDKELLLKDLCARLPYGVKIELMPITRGKCATLTPTILGDYYISDDVNYLPYLRPMSSMTEEEAKEYFSIQTGSIRSDMSAKIDFYIKHHFDFRLTSEGLSMIEAGLAIEAPEGMYN